MDDEGILFDLTGCDVQRRAPVNATYAQTFAACAYVLKCLVDADVPVNGLLRACADRGAARYCRQLHCAGSGHRWLGNPDAARRRDIESAVTSGA